MKERIPLQIIENRLILTAVIECEHLRIRHKLIAFVIDTGSADSFLSDNDVTRFQIPIAGKPSKGEIDVGGSRFQQVILPKFKMHLLNGDKEEKLLNATLSALKTTKVSEKKVMVAQTLPSILGLDFLMEQKLSLHLIPTENLAYLELE